MLEEVRGNVIFTVSGADAASSAVDVSDETPSAFGPIAITTSRCDPHALIEYKRTLILSAYVALNGVGRTRVDITAKAAPDARSRSC